MLQCHQKHCNAVDLYQGNLQTKHEST